MSSRTLREIHGSYRHYKIKFKNFQVVVFSDFQGLILFSNINFSQPTCVYVAQVLMVGKKVCFFAFIIILVCIYNETKWLKLLAKILYKIVKKLKVSVEVDFLWCGIYPTKTLRCVKGRFSNVPLKPSNIISGSGRPLERFPNLSGPEPSCQRCTRMMTVFRHHWGVCITSAKEQLNFLCSVSFSLDMSEYSWYVSINDCAISEVV